MFDPKKMTLEMIQMSKMVFDQSYNTLTLMQTQMERLGQMCWGQVGSYPEEAKKNMAEWQAAYKKQCEQAKAMVDSGFQNLETLVA